MNALALDARALWRARSLLWVLTRREVAARHAGTAAGVLWPYLQPLLSIAAYYLVFDVVFSLRLGTSGTSHPVGTFLIAGALPWMAFCDAVSRAMSSLVDAGQLLQKNALPPVLFVARSVLASACVYWPLMFAVALAFAPHHRFQWPVLGLLALWALMLGLCILLGYVLAILAAALRDTVHFVGFLLTVGIYLAPVLFPLTMFPERWRWLLWVNPMTAPVIGFQSVLLQGEWPPLEIWLVQAVWLAMLLALLELLIARSRDQLVDWL